ncbi:hypothetical protein ACMG5I_03490 [Escherichia coli]|uniref:hypothetical protein n=1 Tax=Escherichia coli TaxID=562 RepID=UPI0023779143|nr:hypothetical protein vBEcoMphAPEC6_02550 [Escherichia phage ph0011]
MKSILVAVNQIASPSFNFKQAVADKLKKICPNAELTFCVFDSEKVSTVDLNYIINDIKSISGESNLNLLNEIADDYDHTLVISEKY